MGYESGGMKRLIPWCWVVLPQAWSQLLLLENQSCTKRSKAIGYFQPTIMTSKTALTRSSKLFSTSWRADAWENDMGYARP